MALAEKVLIFFALFHKLEPTEKICSPCITITSHDGIDDDLAGTYRYIYINRPVLYYIIVNIDIFLNNNYFYLVLAYVI